MTSEEIDALKRKWSTGVAFTASELHACLRAAQANERLELCLAERDKVIEGKLVEQWCAFAASAISGVSIKDVSPKTMTDRAADYADELLQKAQERFVRK
jgi:hypothetical protein